MFGSNRYLAAVNEPDEKDGQAEGMITRKWNHLVVGLLVEYRPTNQPNTKTNHEMGGDLIPGR